MITSSFIFNLWNHLLSFDGGGGGVGAGFT
jgi:hypothetical protein